jgi:hypothetical protein
MGSRTTNNLAANHTFVRLGATSSITSSHTCLTAPFPSWAGTFFPS